MKATKKRNPKKRCQFHIRQALAHIDTAITEVLRLNNHRLAASLEIAKADIEKASQ